MLSKLNGNKYPILSEQLLQSQCKDFARAVSQVAVSKNRLPLSLDSQEEIQEVFQN